MLGISAISIAVVAILFGNYFFALLILIASATLALLAKQPPTTITCTLSESGLAVGLTKFPWETLINFWIQSDDPDMHILSINTKRALSPHMAIPLPPQQSRIIYDFLKEHLPEEEAHEPVSNKLVNLFGL